MSEEKYNNEADADTHVQSGPYDHLMDPNYTGGSVEEAAVRPELTEEELLTRERRQRDDVHWHGNVLRNQRDRDQSTPQ